MPEPIEAFLQTICANPADDAPRLICADFLEESGVPSQVTWAVFIRLQCRLATLPSDDPFRADLQQQETALLARHRRKWNGLVHRRLHCGPLRDQVGTRRSLIRNWQYHRGFIGMVTVHASAVVQHPEELARIGPLETFRIWGCQGRMTELLGSPILRRAQMIDVLDFALPDRDRQLLAGSTLGPRIRLRGASV